MQLKTYDAKQTSSINTIFSIIRQQPGEKLNFNQRIVSRIHLIIYI